MLNPQFLLKETFHFQFVIHVCAVHLFKVLLFGHHFKVIIMIKCNIICAILIQWNGEFYRNYMEMIICAIIKFDKTVSETINSCWIIIICRSTINTTLH